MSEPVDPQLLEDKHILESGMIGSIFGVKLCMMRWHYFKPRRPTKRAIRRYRWKRICVRMTDEEIKAIRENPYLLSKGMMA